MTNDDFRSTEPDEPWARSVQCARIGCDNPVTFPDFESFCTECIREYEAKQKRFAEELACYEVRVLR